MPILERKHYSQNTRNNMQMMIEVSLKPLLEFLKHIRILDMQANLNCFTISGKKHEFHIQRIEDIIMLLIEVL